MVLLRVVLATALVAGCGVTTPARIDLAALVKRLGPADARHELEVRVVKDPKDVAALLALAKLCEQQGRPSQALDALERVLRLGGPLGTRWHDDDRARFARLLAARGRARIARGAPTALADLDRARDHGASISDDERAAAKLARAIVQVRHVDAKERAAGLAALPKRTPGELGVYLWSIGAKRAAYEALAAWHAKTPAPRDERIQAAYLAALAWWTPIDGAPPPESELVGPIRCRYASCDAWDLVQNGVSSDAIDALLLSPPAKTTDPQAAYAWLAITLAHALTAGDTSWAAAFAARVDVAALAPEKLPPGARGAFAIVTGRDIAPSDANDRSWPGRYLAAAVAVNRGAKPDEVRAVLGPLADTREGAALLALVEPAEPIASPFVAAVARYVGGKHDLSKIIAGYLVDPLIADRLTTDVIATFADAAEGHAWAGTLFDALGDPARARASWQAAVDGSAEPVYVYGLARAIARANDPDAALVIATQAAAASGEPSPVWIAVGEALHAAGSNVHALEAARYAIDLSTIETAAAAFDLAIAASTSLGRTNQVDSLRARRAKLPQPPLAAPAAIRDAGDGGDARNARDARDADDWLDGRDPTDPLWNRRDVARRAGLIRSLQATDPRRASLIRDLVNLAGDRDRERGRAAIRALRVIE